MALCVGSLTDGLIMVDHALVEKPEARYLIWRVSEGQPWYISEMNKMGGCIQAGMESKFRNLMVVDNEVLADLKQAVIAWKVGG